MYLLRKKVQVLHVVQYNEGVILGMKFGKKINNNVSQVLMVGAAVSVVLSAAGWLGQDYWLASTQWLLVASVLALFGTYLKVS